MPTTTATTSSYAVLGLLAIAPFTAHELTAQSRRSLHWVWPRSERALYAEPKRLVALGWATTRDRRIGRRRVPEYRITAAGRHALRAWLGTTPAEPGTEIEAMVRLLFADASDAGDLRRSLQTNRDYLHTAVLNQLVGQCRGYLDDGGPFPDRLHLIGLYTDFYVRFIELLDSWTTDALEEINQWPSTRGVGMTPAARRIFQQVIEQYGERSPRIDVP